MLNSVPMQSTSISAEAEAVHISGAGPAGLAAAITLAQGGARVVVHERRAAVGGRFHGDFQGQENWSSPGDVIDELAAAIGIVAEFPRVPFHSLTAYDAYGREYIFRNEQPLFYLVRRGSGSDTLDTVLLAQAETLGVEVRFNDRIRHLPKGGICAEGPRAGDVIAAGYLFETDMADGAWAALSDALAPEGYTYLLVHEGHATLASCFFADFHNERTHLANSVAFFEEKLGFRMPDSAKHFGGLGNVSYPATARKGNILYVGEAAGFQDALWGFGMRYAMISGALAAKAWLAGKPESYDHLWCQALGGRMRAGIVNRWLFSRLGDRGYGRFLQRLTASGDGRRWLMRHHQERWHTRLLFPWANRRLPSRRAEYRCANPECSCTWCKCRHAEAARMQGPGNEESCRRADTGDQ